MLLHKKITEALSLITSVENELSQHHDLTSGELVIGAGDSICENQCDQWNIIRNN